MVFAIMVTLRRYKLSCTRLETVFLTALHVLLLVLICLVVSSSHYIVQIARPVNIRR